MAEDTSQPIPSPNEVFIDRYRRITPKWYPFMKRLFESLRTTIRTVSSVELDVDNLNTEVTEVIQIVDNVTGQWGIAVNSQGRVTAAIRLDGSPAQSSFAILADRFIVVNPTNNGQTIQAFVVGLVSGVSTVGINGNLIVDGSILARHIAAESITADKIAAESITASELAANAVSAVKIQAGAITADKIAAGQVTADKIAAGSVTADKISVASLQAVSGTMGSLVTGRIQSPDGRLDINALGTSPYIRLTT